MTQLRAAKAVANPGLPEFIRSAPARQASAEPMYRRPTRLAGFLPRGPEVSTARRSGPLSITPAVERSVAQAFPSIPVVANPAPYTIRVEPSLKRPIPETGLHLKRHSFVGSAGRALRRPCNDPAKGAALSERGRPLDIERPFRTVTPRKRHSLGRAAGRRIRGRECRAQFWVAAIQDALAALVVVFRSPTGKSDRLLHNLRRTFGPGCRPRQDRVRPTWGSVSGSHWVRPLRREDLDPVLACPGVKSPGWPASG